VQISLGHWTYTIAAVFNSRGEAKRSTRKIARSLYGQVPTPEGRELVSDEDENMWNDVSWNADEDTIIEVRRNRVYLTVHTDGWDGVEQIKDIFQRHGAKQIIQYTDAEEFDVRFAFNTAFNTSYGSKLEEIKKLLGLKHPNLEPLFNNSRASVKRKGKTTVCIFHYFGDHAYDDQKNTLFGYPVDEIGCRIIYRDED